MPAIFVRSKATQSNSGKRFGGFIGYIGRTDAFQLKEMTDQEIKEQIVNDGNFTNEAFKNYIFYEKNPLKADGLFDNYNDKLSSKQQRMLVRDVTKAEKNGSPLFQDVISFDNDFLDKVGMYNKNTGYLNESFLKDSIRKGVKEMLENEKFSLGDNTIWAAAIHRNTDNIHVHVAITEKKSLRPKKWIDGKNGVGGHYEYKIKRKINNLKNMKHTILENVMDHKTLEKSNNLLANLDKEHKNIKENLVKLMDKNPKELKSIIQSLPMDKTREWRYKSNASDMKEAQNKVNNYVDDMLSSDLNSHYQVFNRLVNQQNDMYKKFYGETSRDENVKDKRLREQMANAVYKEIKNEMKDIQNNLDSKYLDNFDEKDTKNIRSKNIVNIRKSRKKVSQDQIKNINKQLNSLRKEGKDNTSEYIKLSNDFKELSKIDKSFKGKSNKSKLDYEKYIMKYNLSKLELKPKVPLMQKGIVNYDALKNKDLKQIELLNDYSIAKNNYDSLKVNANVNTLNESINNKLKKQYKKINQPNISKTKKSKISTKISSLKQHRKINNVKRSYTFRNTQELKAINHSQYRMETLPPYKYKYEKLFNSQVQDHIHNSYKRNAKFTSLKGNMIFNKVRDNQYLKNKLLRSPRRIKSLASKIRGAGEKVIVHNNQVEREEHRIAIKQFKEEQKIKQSIYYDNLGRDL